jgi:hypothetical protein
MRPALGERDDVVDFLHRNIPSVLQTHLAKRMLGSVTMTDTHPGSAVAFAGRIPALELLIVLFHLLGMVLTINAVREVRAAGIAARSLWFPWHSRLLSAHKKSPTGLFP